MRDGPGRSHSVDRRWRSERHRPQNEAQHLCRTGVSASACDLNTCRAAHVPRAVIVIPDAAKAAMVRDPNPVSKKPIRWITPREESEAIGGFTAPSVQCNPRGAL